MFSNSEKPEVPEIRPVKSGNPAESRKNLFYQFFVMFTLHLSINLSQKLNQIEFTGNQSPKFVHKKYRKFVHL
jgi:hypothetical protein